MAGRREFCSTGGRRPDRHLRKATMPPVGPPGYSCRPLVILFAALLSATPDQPFTSHLISHTISTLATGEPSRLSSTRAGDRPEIEVRVRQAASEGQSLDNTDRFIARSKASYKFHIMLTENDIQFKDLPGHDAFAVSICSTWFVLQSALGTGGPSQTTSASAKIGCKPACQSYEQEFLSIRLASS